VNRSSALGSGAAGATATSRDASASLKMAERSPNEVLSGEATNAVVDDKTANKIIAWFRNCMMVLLTLCMYRGCSDCLVLVQFNQRISSLL
jgi:hypothetical protein